MHKTSGNTSIHNPGRGHHLFGTEEILQALGLLAMGYLLTVLFFCL